MTSVNSIADKLEKARRDLLDLTTRNRLLSTSRSQTRSGRLEIVDELSEEVFRILVREQKKMTFQHSVKENAPLEFNDDSDAFSQPAEEERETNGVAARHLDSQLQTELSSEQLQRRLLKLHYEARTFEEEQGVNTLFLALGFLKWYEDDRSDKERFAPLLLIPVRLDRQSAAARFRLHYTEDEITTNLSLQEKLKHDFGLNLPDVPEIEELSPTHYFAVVREAISSKKRWEVLPNDMVLWFFSFAKFLMYRDLQADTWPEGRSIRDHVLVNGVMKDGFRSEPPFCDDVENIDRLLAPLDMIHVVDADSSQTVAIEEVRRGRNLVIQGPPGTGKSQTIANMIAVAVKEGKKVLFVAEKMAALEVVKRRLDHIHLGDMCLELHSNKANKRAVLDELGRTLSLGRPRINDVINQAEQLKNTRDKLNRHPEILHARLDPAPVTVFSALGQLVRLRAAGIEPADFALIDALKWSSTDVREKRGVLEDLMLHMQELGLPQLHPWRGVKLDAILPTDIDRVKIGLATICRRLDSLVASAEQLAALLNYGNVATPMDCSVAARMGQRLAAAPVMDRQSLASNAWTEKRDAIELLVKSGATLAEMQHSLEGVVAEAAWTMDVGPTRRHLAAHKSIFRIFYRDYRKAAATLRDILQAKPPKSLADRLCIIDHLIQGQKCRSSIEQDQQNRQLGQAAFGGYWRGAQSDWSALKKICDWEKECCEAKIPSTFRHAIGHVVDFKVVDGLVKQVAQQLSPLLEDLQKLFQQIKLDVSIAFGVRDLRLIPLRHLRDRLQLWQDNPEAITNWVAYYMRWRKLDDYGMAPLAQRLDQGKVAAAEALDRFQMAYCETLLREAWRRYPELSQFDGLSHQQVLDQFKQLDIERLTMARQEVAFAHYQGMPQNNGDVGEVGLLRREMKKKRKHLSLRKLLHQAGRAIQTIKPVFMMSPISIAQYLTPGVLDFDLLLIDEASQVRPVDALGAIARVQQIAVVGDERQLPPTRFFNLTSSDDGEETDENEFQAADLESILGLCEAQGMPRRMLQWHYRSRHHSLIAVSNHEFYSDRLYIVPSPSDGGGKLGLRFHHVSDGVFARGGSATNQIEARRVAAAVMEHARQSRDKTLGVGAFSVAQRDAILDELEILRRQATDLESFFATATAEPFFVKNLENIQGDERDVIFISIGYGKDPSGYMAMSFGPLNNDGGERRLNVLITRARERCEVFASITADDIDPHRTQARGPACLKKFLTYAEKGFLDSNVSTHKDCDSDFEREVARAVSACGYRVDPQVGVAGFFVDLGVVDPSCPGRYLLGIECDGAAYHASRSARDRDRLRQQVLEDRGWVIHRIWSTDWFHRPEEQLRKVRAALDRAKAHWAGQSDIREQPARQPTKSIENGSIKRDEVESTDEDLPKAVSSIPYVEADFAAPIASAIHSLSVEQLAGIAGRVVVIEGPVHQDEIARRIATIYGQSRVGSRIADFVERALAEAVFLKLVRQHGLFFAALDQCEMPIRNREHVHSAALRKPEYLPPEEIRAALLACVRAHMGMTIDEVATQVARLFGFRTTSAHLRQVIVDEIDHLVETSLLAGSCGKLYREEPVSDVHN
jgi:very-short-patch-repair endonuclease